MKWLRQLLTGRRPNSAPPCVSVSQPPPPASTEPVAIISDVHGNLPALRAVLDDIEQRGIRERLCLGDMIGRGSNPVECIELLRSSGFKCIQGNHDAYLAGCGTTSDASEGRFIQRRLTRELLGEASCKWLAGLPLTLVEHDFQAVHASLHTPEEWPYILEAAAAQLSMSHQCRSLCFAGHTHIPMMWLEGQAVPIEGSGIESLRKDRRHIVNVGSVGHSRDGDPRACYVIYRRVEHDVWWRRIVYDVGEAQESIADPELLGSPKPIVAIGRHVPHLPSACDEQLASKV